MSEPTAPGLLLLIDEAWHPTETEPDPPMEALLGAWEVADDGTAGRFQPNPVYRPLSTSSPLDPVDAVLRRLAQTGNGAEDLRSVLRAATLGIAVDDEGVALISRAPDDSRAVLVATAHGHRRLIGASRWADVTVDELATALPDTGVDVLLNPGAPASMLLLAEAIREIATDAG